MWRVWVRESVYKVLVGKSEGRRPVEKILLKWYFWIVETAIMELLKSVGS